MFSENLISKLCSSVLLMILISILSGCSYLSLKDEKTPLPVKTIAYQITESAEPAWINSLVAELNSKPVLDSPESISQYLYKGKIVYYFAPACCGKMSNLYDEQKNIICKPDGGDDGRGDGKCPGFTAERKHGKIIWEENRD
jgi:hypothetical protein